MKLGLGLYRLMLTAENFRFARQCGCTQVIVHRVDYFHHGGGDLQNQPEALRVLEILRQNHFDGVIIPDHTPQMDCGAPWHAGMALALGYFRAALPRLQEAAQS